LEETSQALHDPEGGSPIIGVVISDIPAQKRAEEGAGAFAKMARQASLLDAVMESLPVGLALLDAEGGHHAGKPRV
jgi:hypothetical protein